MNNLPRQKLCEIIAQYGRSLCDEPRRCEGLLRDFCGEHKREINVLVGALKERIATDLLASSPNVPYEVLIARLVKRLQDDLAFTEDAARWAVESWALALGVISSAEIERQQKAPEVLRPSPRCERVPVPSAEESPKTQTEVEYPKPIIPSATIVNPIDGAEMILIPAGEFIMGTNDKQIEELLRQVPPWKRERFTVDQPQHSVNLDDFYIDKCPVTNAQFEQFVKATGYKAKGDWRKYYTKGKEKHPVVCVSWNDASAYCKWAGKQLPTEAKWEKAARGADGRIWPWGNAWDKSKCNSSDGGPRTTTPVGSYLAGASPYGVMDMAGNVLEWCADWYDEKYYASAPDRNPQGPSSGTWRVLRGGSWVSYPIATLAAVRYRDHPDNWTNYRGFRGVALRLPR